ncbi:hypothetical protein M8818_003534 [Zalaria obscura]|uniref:Uncharacterized protein n=1 Tax=Zalaria obscura TaxID=2024903 RepID=A0ACC3SEZ5_9PEZI
MAEKRVGSPPGPSRPTIHTNAMPNRDTKDNALIFLESHKDETGINLSQNEGFTRSLRRRIDMRVMPFLCLCYTVNFLDKVLLNVSHTSKMWEAQLTGRSIPCCQVARHLSCGVGYRDRMSRSAHQLSRSLSRPHNQWSIRGRHSTCCSAANTSLEQSKPLDSPTGTAV